MTLATRPIPRRTINGFRGGRPLGHDYWFAPRDGDLYPNESTVIQTTRLESGPSDGVASNWMWALANARNHDLWLVVPLTTSDTSKESADLRASLLRAAVRVGLRLITQKVNDRLYVYPSDRP